MAVAAANGSSGAMISSSTPVDGGQRSDPDPNALLGRAKVQKLSTSSVFERMRPLICSIASSIGESSGFFIDHKGTVLTAFHNIPAAQMDQIQIRHQAHPKPVFPNPADGLVLENAEALDLFLLESGMEVSEQAIIPLLPDDIPLKEGMKVYFAGYPLSQQTVTFHRGGISSITEEQGITRFTIDGTVVPGNSGGPVVVQHEGTLYLAGVMTSEVADFRPEDLRTIAIMKALSEDKKRQAEQSARGRRSMGPGSIVINSSGVTTTAPIPASTVSIATSKGVETIEVNDRDTVCLALDLIQRNLSTGLGKAIDARHYSLLTSNQHRLEPTSQYSFPVGKPYKHYLTDDTRAKKVTVKYREELIGGAGRGDRGICINLEKPFGDGSYSYRFSPNPHTAEGNYNKNQKDLYDKAAVAIVQQYQKDKKMPELVEFKACGTRYEATLE